MDGSIPPSSSISVASSSSSSAIFRPRRSDDWHEYRPRIEQLYRIHQLKLRDVKKIMEREHNFVASEKQYKDRLAAWHVRKNIKAKEVHVMLRKQQKRASRGKATAFRVAGQPVDTKRIARFVRRYGPNWETRKNAHSQSSPEPDTPSDMSCYTPEPEEKPSLNGLNGLPEMHSHFDDSERLDPIPDSELDDVNSLPATLSPSLPNETPKTMDEQLGAQLGTNNSWDELDSFQDRLLALHKTLEQSMSEYITPQDD